MKKISFILSIDPEFRLIFFSFLDNFGDIVLKKILGHQFDSIEFSLFFVKLYLDQLYHLVIVKIF